MAEAEAAMAVVVTNADRVKSAAPERNGVPVKSEAPAKIAVPARVAAAMSATRESARPKPVRPQTTRRLHVKVVPSVPVLNVNRAVTASPVAPRKVPKAGAVAARVPGQMRRLALQPPRMSQPQTQRRCSRKTVRSCRPNPPRTACR